MSRQRTATDLGPLIGRDKSARLVQERIVEDRRAEGQRARRADPLNNIDLGDVLQTAVRRAAADTLRDLADAAHGVQGERPERVDRAHDPTALLPAERNMAARIAYSRARESVGAEYLPVVDFVVIGWGTLSGYVAIAKVRRTTAAKWLRRGLDRVP